jgi:hypothetical protein
VSVATWDVRETLDWGLQRRQAEDDWIAAHQGALSASQFGACLRREKFRLMGTERTNPPTIHQQRRWRWGLMYQQEVYRRALDADRRPRLNAEVEVPIGDTGVVIRGMPDQVWTEGVLEIKTTQAWEMHPDHLPFPHLMQLGTYMHGLNKPGQLLYASWNHEWTFDFPTLPEMWEPWAHEVGWLFQHHPEPDPLPYPPERLYCASCPYVEACPSDTQGSGDAVLTELQRQIVERYLAENAIAKTSEKRAEEAKAAVLGLKEIAGQDAKGLTRLRLPDKVVVIREGIQQRTDYGALDPKIKAALPKKTIITNTITTKESDDD